MNSLPKKQSLENSVNYIMLLLVGILTALCLLSCSPGKLASKQGIVATMTSDAAAQEIRFALAARLAPICAGKPDPTAAEFKTGAELHPALIYPLGRQYSLPEEVLPKGEADLEVVVCIAESKHEYKKEYGSILRGTRGNYCTTITPVVAITLRKAATAEILYQENLYGLGGCAETEKFTQNQTNKVVKAKDVTSEAIFKAVKKYLTSEFTGILQLTGGGLISVTQYGPKDPYIYTLDVSTGITNTLTNNGQRLEGEDPAISQDGTILFTWQDLQKKYEEEVWIINFLETQGVKHTDIDRILLRKPDLELHSPTTALHGRQPIGSPDGSQIVFICDWEGHANLCRLDKSNEDPKDLKYDIYKDFLYITQDKFEHLTPSWKDDNTILYSSNQSGSWEIWSIDTAGKNPTQLTRTGDKDGYGWPVTSPDGKTILFECAGSSEREICLLNETGEVNYLTNNEYYDGRPVWSPDGKFIAYSSSADGEKYLWFMSADGSQSIKSNLVNASSRTWVSLP